MLVQRDLVANHKMDFPNFEIFYGGGVKTPVSYTHLDVYKRQL